MSSKSESVLDYALHELSRHSFIYEIRHALTRKVCDDMIRRFEAHPEQQYSGRIGPQHDQESSIKRSTDLRISGRKDWRAVDEGLFLSLSAAVNEIAKIHPFFAANSLRDMGYNMQRTQQEEFYHWHVDSGPGEFSQRQLVAIWYLNDVDGPGGETEFYFQEIKIKPETGKLILFPPFWTHAHRGVTLQQGTKYIATTWVCYSGDIEPAPKK